MKNTLNLLFEHHELSRPEARQLMLDITAGKVNQSQTSALLAVYRLRAITVSELQGFREALLEVCNRVDLSDYSPIDLCGTGGDGKNTFNISTLSAFVVAGAGQPVAKHGNYGVSSLCGSSNLLEHLGITFANSEAGLKRQLDLAGICFLHAPLFHPAMKAVAPVRGELGLRTFFNILGPLVNPATPIVQCSGVSSLQLLRLYSYLLQFEAERFMVMHSLCGYDELSLTGAFKIFSDQEELVMEPEEIGFDRITPEALHGGDTIKECAATFLNILHARGTDQQHSVVIVNAAMALRVARPELDLTEAVALARESLLSRRAFAAFENLLKLSEN